MLEVNKNRIPVKSWCMQPESGALDQASNVANLDRAFHHVVLCSDTHQGYGMPIGGVSALDSAISPNMVGVDIACGMMAVQTDIPREILTPEILKQIIVQVRRDVPMGFGHQSTDKYKKEASELFMNWMASSVCAKGIDDEEVTIEPIYSQLGTLGGGKMIASRLRV